VVEDYSDLRLAILDVLDHAHYDCVGVPSAEDAISKLKAGHYAAIVLDPLADAATDPVMLFLRREQPGEVGKVVLLGDEGLRKPFNSSELLARIGV
jgi:DNA-binding response OmpR family regulator